MSTRVYLAVDLGAESGRVMAAVFANGKITLEEMARVRTGGVLLPDGWHWDLLRIYADIRTGITSAVAAHGDAVVSVAVDTWGVDYGLLDEGGHLLGLPWMYRDARTDGMMEVAAQTVKAEDLYRRTGLQPMFFNTVYQLLAETRQHAAVVKASARLAFVPDLLTYWLSGERTVERTIASTSGLLKAGTAEVTPHFEVSARRKTCAARSTTECLSWACASLASLKPRSASMPRQERKAASRW